MTNTPDSVTNGFRRLLCFVFLWDMKHAERIFIFLILSLSMPACGLNQVDESQHSNAEGVWEGPSFGYYSEDKCYAVALDYPEGYDWKSDPDRGHVKCHMVMFADGIPVLRIPVNDASYVSSDPTCHFVVQGHLFTSYTDGESTVVKKDGQILYVWSGAESVDDMILVDGLLHMLSSPCGKEGFFYRVDGETVVERQSGYSFRHLDENDGHVVFYFCQDKDVSEGSRTSYYKVVDGKVHKFEMSVDGKVTDIRLSGRDVALSIADDGNAMPVLTTDIRKEVLRVGENCNVVSAVFIDHERPCVWARYAHTDTDAMTDVIWTGRNEWKMYWRGCTYASAYMDKTGCCAVINPHDGRNGRIFSGVRFYAMPAGFSVFTRDCMTRKKDVLHVGLTASDGGKPVIWREGESSDTLNVNGPVISLQ